MKLREEAEAAKGEKGSAPVPVPLPVPELGEDAIYEVLRRADARTLAAAACVSRRWRRLAADERLWEAACARHWEAARDYGGARLRPVVLALGGFRRLHSLYLAPLLRPPSSHSPSPPIAASSSSSPPIAAAEGAVAWPIVAAARATRPSAAAGRRWGRDEAEMQKLVEENSTTESNAKQHVDEKKHHSLLLQLIADQASCEPDAICDFELQLCDTQPSIIGGAAKEFIFSGRLDNLCMSFCSLKAGGFRWGIIYIEHEE